MPMLKVVSSWAGETYWISITQRQPASAAMKPEIA